MNADLLPLQDGLRASSMVADEPIEPMFIAAHADGGHIHARVGVSYFGITGGCSCADDPTPTPLQAEYCELVVTIDRTDASARVRLAGD